MNNNKKNDNKQIYKEMDYKELTENLNTEWDNLVSLFPKNQLDRYNNVIEQGNQNMLIYHRTLQMALYGWREWIEAKPKIKQQINVINNIVREMRLWLKVYK